MIPAAPASASRRAASRAVAAADDLVRVAHRHERDAGRAAAIRADELDRAVEGRAGRERRRRRALERRAVGERVGVRQPDLEHVGAGVDRGEGGLVARLGVRVAGDDVRDQRGPAAPRAPPRRRAAIRRAPAVSFGPGRVRCRRRVAVTPCALPPPPERREVLVAAPGEARAARARPRRVRRAAALGAGEEPRQRRDRVGRLERRAGCPRSRR